MSRPIVAVGAPEGAPPATLSAASTTQAVADVVASVAGDVLLVTRDRQSRQVARAARLAIGAERVGILHTPLPYTAWFATLQVLGSMPQDVEISRSAGIARTLSGVLHTRAVLSSVAALERPAPTFGQHVRGLLPGARFLVDLSAKTVGPFTGSLPADSPLVVVARSEKPVVDGLGADWPEGRAEIGAVDAGWKAARWLEVTTLDERQWYEITAELRRPDVRNPRCPACDRPGALATCLFCDVPLSSVVTDPAAVEPVEGVSA